MAQLKSTHKHFNKSSKKSGSNIIHNMTYTPNFSSFGPREASQSNSWSQHKFKQAHTMHPIMYQLQAIIKQKPNMINEWNESHGKLQDVYNTHVKFQVHPINNKNFTNHMVSWLTKGSQLVKQRENSQTNRKCIQKSQEKSQANNSQCTKVQAIRHKLKSQTLQNKPKLVINNQ